MVLGNSNDDSWFRTSGWRKEQGQANSKSCEVHPERIGNVPNESRQWTVFEFADALEQGLSPGLTSTHMEPPTDSNAEQRLRVQRSPNTCEYTLTSEKGETILVARGNADGTRYEIFIARDGQPPKLLGPAFILQGNASREQWTLHAVRCDRCEAHGRRKCGTRELARMSHYCEMVGDGQALCIDLDIPDVREDGSLAVFCDVCGDSASSSEVRFLTTRRPKWNPKHKSLTLDFHGRCSLASAKNFMLEDPDNPGKVKLLFGKVGEQQFVLDYRHPLGTVQAFAAALSSSHWK